MKDLSDLELLEAYSRDRTEDAFRELVVRHIDLIYSAALRQLRNSHLAEEATQGAFIALADKAGSLRSGTVIAAWLYRAVHFAALNLQRSEARRKFWEEEAAVMNRPDESHPSFEEMALPHIDGLLAELNDSDRTALILRFLQQRTFRDVAVALGTSEEAAKKRVTRALDKLRSLLARRHITISATILAAGLSQIPMIAAPSGLSAALAAQLATTATLSNLTLTAKAAKLLVKGRLVVAGSLALITLALIFHHRTLLGMLSSTFSDTRQKRVPRDLREYRRLHK